MNVKTKWNKDEAALLLKDIMDKRVDRLIKISMESMLSGRVVTKKTSRGIIRATYDNMASERALKRHFKS